MKNSSVNALLVLSVVLLVPGTAIISPEGRLLFLVLAGICASVAVIWGKPKGKRIAAAVVLATVLVLALLGYSEHQTSFQKYRDRAVRTK